LVPALWALYNAVWLLILATFGGTATVLWLYGGAMALVEGFAAMVVLSGLRHPLAERSYQVPARGEVGILAASGCLLVGLGFVFGSWFFPLGGVTLSLAVIQIGKDIRTRQRLTS
jgi:hypothetical protein